MKIKKSDLKFLKEYSAISETSTVLGNKLKIDVKNNTVTYSQRSKDATLITTIPCSTNEEFNLLIDTKTFWDFINTLDDDEELNVNEDGFSIGQDKKYTFDVSELDFVNVDEILNLIEESKKSSDTVSFDFNEYEQLKTVYSFMGKDSLESIGLMKNKILSTDRIQIVYRDCNFSLDKNYFISKLAGQLLRENSNFTTKIYLTDDFYFFYMGNTVCIFEWRTFTIPDLFQDSAYSKFNQTDSIEINKKELKTSLKRMSFFTFNNPSYRIFITINEDHLLIENRDFNKSYEKVILTKPNKALNGITVIVNSNNILNFINLLEDDSILIFVNPSKDNRNTIRFEDMDGKYKFVHLLLKEDL
jgi:hypothetical protein